jgi:hypothetical protein
MGNSESARRLSAASTSSSLPPCSSRPDQRLLRRRRVGSDGGATVSSGGGSPGLSATVARRLATADPRGPDSQTPRTKSGRLVEGSLLSPRPNRPAGEKARGCRPARRRPDHSSRGRTKRPELRIATALGLGAATQKVVDHVLQAGSPGIELFVPVPDQAAAVRTGDPLAPVAWLSVCNLVIALDISRTTSVCGSSGMTAYGPPDR